MTTPQSTASKWRVWPLACAPFALVLALPVQAQTLTDPANTPMCRAPVAGDTCSAAGGTNNGAGNPINVLTGNKYQVEVDMAPLPGELGLEVVRHYNSTESRVVGLTGMGWRLSYEVDLYVAGNTVQIVQADGARLIFNKDPLNPAVCSAGDPRYGRVLIKSTAGGHEYVWEKTHGAEAGRVLSFNSQGKLERIQSASGAVVSLVRGPSGELLSVTDPQGRSMSLRYASKEQLQAARQEAVQGLKQTAVFGGVKMIDTPVGRIAYEHGSQATGGTAASGTAASEELIKAQAANLSRVSLPTNYEAGKPAHVLANRGVSSSSVSRSYHYEDARWPAQLTGISVSGMGSDGKTVNQRISTYLYDERGRGILSVLGEPARLQRTQDGQVKEPKQLEPGTGVEQVHVAYVEPALHNKLGKTVITNALGQETIYRGQIVGGEYRLTEVLGAGCAQCGPANVRYRYDGQGKQLEQQQLSAVVVRGGREQGPAQVLSAQRTSYDALGRISRVESISYQNSKAQAPVMLARYEYEDRTNQNAQSQATVNQPTLIAKPSVIPGREHQTSLSYNERGQLTSVTHSGYSPIDKEGKPNPTPITRTTRYAYQTVESSNVSVLSQIDGPQRNGPKQDPSDSDITVYEHGPRGAYLVSSTVPGGFKTTYGRDEAGRVTTSSLNDGYRRIDTRTVYAGLGAIANEVQGISMVAWLRKASGAGQASEQGLDESSKLTLNVVTNKHDAAGRVSSVGDGPGRYIQLQYDQAGRLVTVTDAQGYKAQTTLDSEGHALVAALHEPNQSVPLSNASAPLSNAGVPLRATYRWYDEQSRLVKQLKADGRLETWRYDAQGRLKQHVDEEGVLHVQRTNQRGVAADISLAADGDVRATLLVPGSLQAQSSQQPQVDKLYQRVDDFARPVVVYRPESGVAIKRYDEAGRVVSQTRLDTKTQPAGKVEQRYDLAGHVIERKTFDAQGVLVQTINWRYESGRLVEQVDDAQQGKFVHDALGREVSREVVLKDEGGRAVFQAKLGTSYDEKGQATDKTLADGRVLRVQRQGMEQGGQGVAQKLALQSEGWRQVHDKLGTWLPQGLASKVQGWLPQEVVVENIAFHPFNGITGYGYGNGLMHAKAFDIAGRVKALKTGVQSIGYDYAVGPKVRAMLEEGKAQQRYDYWGFGGLKEQDKARVIRTAVSNDKEPVVRKEPSVRYDSRGRLEDDGVSQYSYTEDGQLSTVSRQGTVIAKYRYNAQMQRVRKTVMSQRDPSNSSTNQAHTTYYLWQDGRLVAEITGEGEHRGQLSAQYLYLGDQERMQPIAKLETAHARGNATGKGRTLYIHTNHRQEPTAMTDGSRRVVWSERSDAWGYMRASEGQGSGPQNAAELNLRLPGQYFDAETGLHDNWHRTYDPRPSSATRGRYLSPDPMGYPDGDDPYGYVNGDPVNKTDPTGLYSVSVAGSTTFYTGLADLPTFSVPTPQGWSDYLNSDLLFHRYNHRVSTTGLTGDEYRRLTTFIVDNPTPSTEAFPASFEGTPNPATPNHGPFSGRIANAVAPDDVISYTRTGISGRTYVVNVTAANHSLSSGIVIRGIRCERGTAIFDNYGEGGGFNQSPINLFRNILINNVWYWATEYALEQVTGRRYTVNGRDWTGNN